MRQTRTMTMILSMMRMALVDTVAEMKGLCQMMMMITRRRGSRYEDGILGRFLGVLKAWHMELVG